MDPLTIVIIGGLIVSGVSWLAGKTIGERLFKKKVKAHLDKFFDSLDKIIDEANSANDFKTLVRKSQALVANRDDFKNQLDDLSKLLNSDIDRLSSLVTGKTEAQLQNLESEIRQLVGVIFEKWPGKKIEIKVAKTALLARLGIK